MLDCIGGGLAAAHDPGGAGRRDAVDQCQQFCLSHPSHWLALPYRVHDGSGSSLGRHLAGPASSRHSCIDQRQDDIDHGDAAPGLDLVGDGSRQVP